MDASEEDPSRASWETCKENVRPLKVGRKVEDLESSLQEGRKEGKDAKKREFLREIEEYKGEDPIENWIRYIKWVQEQVPKSGSTSELSEALEQSTKQLYSLVQYREDVRYLRLWVQYADTCNDPTDVFKFLESNHIGLGHCLFYEAYATFLEFRGRYNQADQVYQKGIDRKAQPLEKLNRKFEAFQHRMAKRIQKHLEEDGGLEPHAGYPARSFGEREGSEPSAPSSRTSNDRMAKNVVEEGALQVFQDEDLAVKETSTSAGELAHTSWPYVHGVKSTRKENTQAPAPWNTVSMPSKVHPAERPFLDVYQEAELLSKEKATEIAQYKRKYAMALREADASKPGQARGITSHPSGSSTQHDAKPKPMEKKAYNESLLLNELGEELSCEELRIHEMANAGLIPFQNTVHDGDKTEAGHSESNLDAGQEDGTSCSAVEVGSLDVDACRGSPEEPGLVPRVLDFGERVSPPRFETIADQTVNTKEAFEDIMSMFNDTLQLDTRGKDKHVTKVRSVGDIASSRFGESAQTYGDSLGSNLQGPPRDAPSGSDQGLGVYEDTVFLGSQRRRACDSFDVREDTSFLGPVEATTTRGIQGDETVALPRDAFEDTVCLDRLEAHAIEGDTHASGRESEIADAPTLFLRLGTDSHVPDASNVDDGDGVWIEHDENTPPEGSSGLRSEAQRSLEDPSVEAKALRELDASSAEARGVELLSAEEAHEALEALVARPDEGYQADDFVPYEDT